MKTITQQINWDFKTNGDLKIKDKNGKVIYYENSYGKISDNRPNPCQGKIVEIEGVKYKLVKQ
jgi:DNA/RNA endonuclease YhcR with UshA esterase domain